jgi:magnesium-transporting ATPase (P-type)
MARTCAFAALVFSQVLLAFGFRTSSEPFWKNFFRGKIAVVALGSLALQGAIFRNEFVAKILKCEVLEFRMLLWVIGISAVPLICVELSKSLRRHRNIL